MSSIANIAMGVVRSGLDEVFKDVYKAWGGDKRIDHDVAIELQVPVFAEERLKSLSKKVNALMERQEDLPLDNIWRVEIRENHELLLSDFTLPSASDKLKQVVKESDAPKFIRDALAVLQISQDGTLVEKVGKRISDSVFYILEGDTDGEHTRKEGERCS